MAFADSKIPSDLHPGPHRDALELANEAKFTQAERDAYRKVMDEIQQLRDYGAAQRAEGRTEGRTEGKRDALLRLLEHVGVALTDEERARVHACADAATLDRWFDKALRAKTAADVFS